MSDSLFKNIDDVINHYELLPAHSTIVVGLSGGPDSVFLLHLLMRYQQQKDLTLIAAHLDHQWRTNSGDDAQFCKALAETLGIPIVIAKADELALPVKKSGSQEQLGRTMRRCFFKQVRTAYNADLIALGHHAQDQQETFFIRLIRGASLSGLSAMKPKDRSYIRPLLQTNKADIIAYLDAHSIRYVADPTNESPAFLRNRIRMQVLPALQNSDARFDQNFLRTMTSLQETEAFLTDLTAHAFTELLDPAQTVPAISVQKFIALPSYMQNRVIVHWLIAMQVPFTPSQGLLAEIKRFVLESVQSSHHLYGQWSIIKKNGFLSIGKE